MLELLNSDVLPYCDTFDMMHRYSWSLYRPIFTKQVHDANTRETGSMPSRQLRKVTPSEIEFEGILAIRHPLVFLITQ